MKARLSTLLLLALTLRAHAADQIIFDDALQNEWQNWSWATVSLTNTAPVHGGTRSIRVTAGSWQAFYPAHAAQDAASFSALSFWANGGPTGGQRLALIGLVSGAPVMTNYISPLPTNSWQHYTVSLASLGLVNQPDFDGFYFQESTGAGQPVFYLDDLALIGATNVIPVSNAVAQVQVNVAATRRRIDPRIYGVAYATSNQLRLLNAPLNRQGGNPTSRYNWQANADNRAADYYFASIAYADLPGEHGDTFVQEARDGGAEPSLTVPMLDWVARLGAGRARTWSYSIAKYGPQQQNDSANGWPDMGNGVRANGTLITTNDPNDANTPAGPAFQEGWIRHLTNRWGSATNGGVRYYHLDNEMGIWHSTHQDVHPQGASMDEMRDKMTNYAARIKAVDPDAVVLGPEEWHFYGAIFSGKDAQYESTNGYPGVFPDRAAHGGLDVYPYLLGQMRQASSNAGRRLLDVCTVHYYPQGGEFSDDVSSAMQLRRNRSTRSLWDTNYVDETWLAGNTNTAVVKLIPRLRTWVATNYPGTLTGITEYNWGAEGHINGATAQADVLGLFGREGLDVATRWTTPATGTPTFKAMQMYRNYDGSNSTFGDFSVSVSNSVNPDDLAIFAAQRARDAALTVMLIKKVSTGPTNVVLTLTNFVGAGYAERWQLTATNVITQLAPVALSNATVELVLPPQSITLLVLPEPAARLSIAPNTLWLNATPGQPYVIQAATDGANWQPVSTSTPATTSQAIPTNLGSPFVQFFRAVWQPTP